jgi:hypothetical protein
VWCAAQRSKNAGLKENKHMDLASLRGNATRDFNGVERDVKILSNATETQWRHKKGRIE